MTCARRRCGHEEDPHTHVDGVDYCTFCDCKCFIRRRWWHDLRDHLATRWRQ